MIPSTTYSIAMEVTNVDGTVYTNQPITFVTETSTNNSLYHYSITEPSIKSLS